jgi:5,5'-dehydrodivanillate O-demethylase oxygenase subunit
MARGNRGNRQAMALHGPQAGCIIVRHRRHLGVTTMNESERKVDQLRLLHQTGPTTPMGQLLRKFWHPIALAEEVTPETARPVRVLSEDLTLYRGQSGAPYLVGGRCAHRCTLLHTGRIEDEQIRCMYHGWRYDGTGLCTEIPAEDRPRLKPVKIAAYPVHEYCGLIFAYLGVAPAPAFDLPRKQVLEDGRRTILTNKQVWDCNWFQQVENSLDAVHVSFAHVWGKVGRFGSSVTTKIPELAYSETGAGIRQIATRSKDNVRVSDWTFPNNNHVVTPGPDTGDPWTHISSWPVPVDDTATMRFTLYAVETTAPAEVADLKVKYDLGYSPLAHADDLFRGVIGGVHEAGLISAQDYVAVRGQGVIYDRSQETLSSSDAGVAFLRRIFLRELDAIRAGRPTKQWSRLEEAPHLAPPPDIQAAE